MNRFVCKDFYLGKGVSALTISDRAIDLTEWTQSAFQTIGMFRQKMFQNVKCDELFNFEEFNVVIDLRFIASAIIPFLFEDVSD